MKLKLPEKKNKNKGAESETFSGFDLTGGNAGSSNSGFAASSSAAGDSSDAEKKGPKFRRKKQAADAPEQGRGRSEGRRGARIGSAAGAIKGAFRRDAREERQRARDDMPVYGGFAVGRDSDSDGFAVSVRNAEPILKRLDTASAGKAWTHNLQINLAGAALIVAIFSLILSTAYVPEQIPYALPGAVVFMLIATLESLGKDRIQLITGAVIGVLLIAALIVFRKYIGNGWALIMNQFYDTAEESQAYIYNRFDVGSTGEEHPYRSMHFALIWASSLLGLLAAMPSERFRRGIELGLAVFTMIAFAYYGIIPSSICIAVIAAAIIFVLARGHILASLPVLLIVMLLFGAIILIDPGENYAISRADENFRDRFALNSAYLESQDEGMDDYGNLNNQEEQDNQDANNGSDFMAENKGFIGLAILLLILAGLGAAAWSFRKRIQKKQINNRAGIDSPDPKVAISAMFPYAVRWLQPAGIDVAGKNFGTLVPLIRADVDSRYADRYLDMYDVWKEAVYSDHKMDEEKKFEMESFMKDTISMVKEKGNARTNFINAIRYAL